MCSYLQTYVVYCILAELPMLKRLKIVLNIVSMCPRNRSYAQVQITTKCFTYSLLKY